MAEPLDPEEERSAAPRPFSVRTERLRDDGGAKSVDHPFDTREPMPGPMSRHAAEWGLAALLSGGFLLLIAPVTLVLNLMFWNSGADVISTADMRLALAGGVIGVLAVVGGCMASLTIGARAIQSALTRRQPAGLALAGTMVSALALVLWIIAGADLLMILVSFAR